MSRYDAEKLEYIATLKNNLHRLQCDLVVTATAIKGDGIRLPGLNSDRIFTAAELLEKTRNELNVMEDELRKKEGDR